MSVTLQAFKQEITDLGLESAVGRFYGTYAGNVDSNEDPDFSGRLRLTCPQVWGDTVHEYWAPSRGMPSGQGLGLWLLPNKDDKVWVTFEAGDPRFPIWEYGPFTNAGIPDATRAAAPDPAKIVVLQSTAGHRLVLDNVTKEIRLENQTGIPQPLILGNDWVQLMSDFLTAIGNISAIPVANAVTLPLNSSPNFAAFLAEWNQRFPTALSTVVKAV